MGQARRHSVADTSRDMRENFHVQEMLEGLAAVPLARDGLSRD